MTKKETEKLWTIIDKMTSFQAAIKNDYIKEEIQKAKDILMALPIKGYIWPNSSS